MLRSATQVMTSEACPWKARDVLSGDGGDSAVGAPSLAIQVLGDELKVEGLPCCTVGQPGRLLLLAGHDLKEHSDRRAFCLHTIRSLFVMFCIHATICMPNYTVRATNLSSPGTNYNVCQC